MQISHYLISVGTNVILITSTIWQIASAEAFIHIHGWIRV